MQISARIIGIGAILFVSVFALDAFAPDIPLTEALIGFAIHIIPSLALAVLLAIAWRFEWIGGVLQAIVGVSAFWLVRGSWPVQLLLGAPFMLSGLLFVLHGSLSRRDAEHSAARR